MSAIDWPTANQQDLTIELVRIRVMLERAAEAGGVEGNASNEAPPAAPDVSDSAYAIGQVCGVFELSPFERDILLLCAGCELDARFRTLLRRIDGRDQPTFGLALGVLPHAHWSAVMPDGPLRRWHCVDVGEGPLTGAPLRIDERILHLLAGLDLCDERLAALAIDLPERRSLSAADQRVADRVTDLCKSGVIAQLTGGDADRRRQVAATACHSLGCRGLSIRAGDLPANPTDRRRIVRLLLRETLINGTFPVIETSVPDDGRAAVFADALAIPSIVMTTEPLSISHESVIVEIPAVTRDERLSLWTAALGPAAETLNGSLPLIATQFALDERSIRIAASRALESAADRDPQPLGAAMWDACRALARPRLEGLATRIEAVAGWDDLVLPGPQVRALHQIATHVRHRARVYEDWGFAAKSHRGLGITALFTGASGTGKTMAAEVIARELRLDLYRVDLAGVVSKYIGETEKNLKRVFDAAEGTGAVLLFDEADALFGKRSEVKDSHDRYANIEVSYLLQRMEAYRGLAILTSNMKQAVDPAFLRRIRFVVTFPFPDTAHRAAIWRKVFPPQVPTGALDFDRLAQLSVAGGHIRNIALAAAFVAADCDERVSMHHLVEAARTEYAKLERPLTDAETRGWM